MGMFYTNFRIFFDFCGIQMVDLNVTTIIYSINLEIYIVYVTLLVRDQCALREEAQEIGGGDPGEDGTRRERDVVCS